MSSPAMLFPPPLKRMPILADKLRELKDLTSFVAIPRGQDAKSRRNAIYTTARRLGLTVQIGPCPASAHLDADRYFGVWRIAK